MTGFVVQGHIFGYLIVDTYFYYFYLKMPSSELSFAII